MARCPDYSAIDQTLVVGTQFGVEVVVILLYQTGSDLAQSYHHFRQCDLDLLPMRQTWAILPELEVLDWVVIRWVQVEM